jgi:hypothetical protein
MTRGPSHRGVVFVGSARTWPAAMKKGKKSPPAPKTSIVIYEALNIARQTLLSRRTSNPGSAVREGKHLVYRKRTGFDVFRVRNDLLHDDRKLAKAIDGIVGRDGPGQSPPSGVEPRIVGSK